MISTGQRSPRSGQPYSVLFFCHYTPTTQIYTLSLHDALPISGSVSSAAGTVRGGGGSRRNSGCRSRKSRSEEHTSELQSRLHLVCRLLLEKKKTKRSSFP